MSINLRSSQSGPASASQGGQSIIEVLIAMSAAIVVIAAITVAVTTSLNNAYFSKNQNLAVDSAQEGIEIIRQMRNQTPANFFAKPEGRYCFGASVTDIANLTTYSALNGCGVSGVANISNYFLRTASFYQSGSVSPNYRCVSDTQVSVTVSWSDGACTTGSIDNVYCHKSQLDSCFSNSYIVPTP